MNQEQEQLLAKAHDSLRAAQLLVNEGFYDFAVSRAYYTMFYIAEAFLLEENLVFSKHSAVIAKFGEYFARTGKVPVQYHRYLIQAEQSRIKADYETAASASEAEAIEQTSRAEAFISLAETELS